MQQGLEVHAEQVARVQNLLARGGCLGIEAGEAVLEDLDCYVHEFSVKART